MGKFILGALAGATIALLLAPSSGGELREELSQQLDDRMDQGKTAVRKASRRARELSDQAQEQVRRVTGAAADAVRE